MTKTLYDILQVSTKADIEVIDAAYTRLREKNDGDDVTLKAIKQAYETLSDPALRATYDQRFASQTIPPRANVTYRSDLATESDGWWRSPMLAKTLVVAALLGGVAMFMNYKMHDKEVAVSRTLTGNDARRVGNDRVYIDRSMDNQGRAVDNVGQALHRNANVQDQAEARRARELDAMTTRSEEESRRRDEAIRLARERQETQLANIKPMNSAGKKITIVESHNNRHAIARSFAGFIKKTMAGARSANFRCREAVLVMRLHTLLIAKNDGGRYWDRTSGFHRVKVALYR